MDAEIDGATTVSIIGLLPCFESDSEKAPKSVNSKETCKLVLSGDLSIPIAIT